MLVRERPFGERTLRLRGLDFRVCEWGPEDGPLVLILHGWLDQGAAWNRVAQHLADAGFRVVAPDQRGHGCSAHTPAGTSYHFSEYLADLDALYDALEAPVQLLVGHSMGGTVASLYAGLRPDRVRHLVLVEGLGPVVETVEKAVDQLTTWLDHQKREWKSPRMANIDAAANRLRRFNPGLPREEAWLLAERSTIPAEDGRIWRWDPRHRSRSAVAYDVERHRECISRIRARVCFVLGRESWYAGIPDLEERLSVIPNLVRRELPGGHALHIDSPEQLARIFVETLGATSL